MMNRGEIVKRIKQSVIENVPDAKIILYGSEARGESSVDSDIDVVILLDRLALSWKDKSFLMDILYEIELESGVLIHPLIKTKTEWENQPFKTPFYQNVVNEGVVL